METNCTKLSNRVLDQLEKEIAMLKKRVKILEDRERSRSDKEDASGQGMNLNTLPLIDPKDKGKAKLVEEEPNKNEPESDEQLAKKLQAELDSEGREEGGRSKKRLGSMLEQETSPKKQNVSNEQEQEPAVMPLGGKAPIVDWRNTKVGNKTYYEIIRNDGSVQRSRVFSNLLDMFDRDDLQTFYNLVMARYGTTPPDGDDRVLWSDLRTMFEPISYQEVWRTQGCQVKRWKLHESCGVHTIMKEAGHYYMLVEQEYPLTKTTLKQMIDKKDQLKPESETSKQLIRFIQNQLQQ